MAITRVHILAKELGVQSKAIVDKCQAEGLDIKNHMSTISAGLAATIREWFSDGEHTTTVETTERVDLEKARIKKPHKKAAAAVPPEEESTDKQITAVPEPPAAEAIQTDSSHIAVMQPSQTAAAETAGPAVATGSSAVVVQPPPAPPSGPVIVAPPPAVKPVLIVPAGPKLEKPAPVKLTGPKIIRVEAPEPVRKPPPSRHKPPQIHTGKAKFDAKPTESVMQTAPPELITPGRGKKSKRKHRYGDAGEDSHETLPKIRLMKDRDIEERRARLEAAGAESLRMRPTRKIEARHKSDLQQQHRPQTAHITEPITVKDLSNALAVKTADIITKLMQHGVMATANQILSTDSAEIVALDFGTELIVDRRKSLEEQIAEEFRNRVGKNAERRPPVVTMLGHVDHGKTSLLDRIRRADVASGEAGGITQHIGAYQVAFGEKGEKKITFLDTPGHEAFTAMRARGANMTDIVVLVVAADDGVMPQTVEAIHHAKAAGVEIIVALNKIDLPGANLHRIYGQLAEHELTPAEWGGNTEVVKTSAITGQGIEDLLEHIYYISDLHEYKADPTVPATGWVVEAKMSPTQGAVATLLVKEGILKIGDIVLAGAAFGRVRTLIDSHGKKIRQATSSMPVSISGLSDVPQAGDRFYRLDDLNKAKLAAEDNQMRQRTENLVSRSKVTLDNLFSQIEAGNIRELNLIVRADVQGSVDVLNKYLNELSTPEVKIRILHSDVGGITEGDVVLAEASEAIIIGFNVVPEEQARKIAEAKGIDIRLYNIIYRITEDLKAAMSGMLEPEERQKHIGRLVVREVFKISGVGTVAGCYVGDGAVYRNSKIRLIRNNVVVKDGLNIDSLKHFKEDVREVKQGLECGLKIAGFDDIKKDDIFEAYEIEKVARTI